MKLVCVLDMDETLGVFKNDIFHVRPKIDVLINLLLLLNVDIILWSLGDDDYVKRVVNGFLPKIALYAYKLFARKESGASMTNYNYAKAGEHIRIMFENPIFLIGIDDQAKHNMNSTYDLTIYISPYNKINGNDREILKVCETLIQNLAKFKIV